MMWTFLIRQDMCKKIRNKKILLYAEKKSQFSQLEFLAIAATPRLKKSSHLHEF